MHVKTAVGQGSGAEMASALRENGFRGPLLLQGDEPYDGARAIWNAMYDRCPGVIAQCRGVADVQTAIAFARENGITPAVRGGGHGAPGYAICDDGMVIDVSLMKGMWVDPATRTARAEAGLTWGEFDRETQLHGLATPGGAVSTTGIAGLTLGGGYGFLSRKYGLTCDNVLSFDVVTAEGELVVASEEENSELYWALRGGGGNFGVVTSFKYQLHRVGPTVLAGVVIHPIENAREVLQFYREFGATAPRELGLNCFIVHAAPLPGVPEEMYWKQVIIPMCCWHGPLDEGEEVIRPLREFGPPAVDLIGQIPYTGIQSMLDEVGRAGRRSYWKSGYMSELSDGAIDTVLEWAPRIPCKESLIEINTIGGAISDMAEDGTACSHRDARYNHLIVSMWDDPGEDDANLGYPQESFDAMAPHHDGGVYVNFLSVEGADRVRAAYDPDVYGRLVEVKRRYDPDNLFQRNQNIPPG
jgi:FAD/FMN-containing dehydrogenase